MPDVSYRIQLNTDKKAADTHVLQQYLKNSDDTYKIGDVVCSGDYDKCNSDLAAMLKPKEVLNQKPDFEIYQIKGGDETRNIRFEPMKRLAEQGLKPEFENYNKIYEGNTSALHVYEENNISNKLEAVFEKFNIDRPEDFKGHSLSVSDVVVMEDKAYYVDSVGFQPLMEFVPLEIKQEKFLAELPEQLQLDSKSAVSEALKLNIPPEIMHEACDMVGSDELAATYEAEFEKKNAPTVEAPEQEQPKPQKKMKL